jgi:hypothetical protein
VFMNLPKSLTYKRCAMLPVNEENCVHEVKISQLNLRYSAFRLRGCLATRRLGTLNAVRMIQV